MKQVDVRTDYTAEINSADMQWLNKNYRTRNIFVREEDCETVAYRGDLTESQLEHVIIFIKDKRSSKDIKELISQYETENQVIEPLVGDDKFIKE